MPARFALWGRSAYEVFTGLVRGLGWSGGLVRLPGVHIFGSPNARRARARREKVRAKVRAKFLETDSLMFGEYDVPSPGSPSPCYCDPCVPCHCDP